MPRVLRTRQATRDIARALAYLRRVSPRAADRLEMDLEAAVLRLAQFPESGRTREDLQTGLRSVLVGDYLLFYRLINDGVQILRFLHGAPVICRSSLGPTPEPTPR